MEGLKFWRPRTLEEAAERMSQENSVPLAGGTDLVIEIKKGHCSAEHVVDLTAIPELARIERSGETMEIGSLASFSALGASPVIQEFCPALGEAALSVGSPQIRNRGTIGGNIMNGSAAADTVSPLVALDADAVLLSKAGERVLKLTELLARLENRCSNRGNFLKRCAFLCQKKVTVGHS